jgi:hypothetical protein
MHIPAGHAQTAEGYVQVTGDHLSGHELPAENLSTWTPARAKKPLIHMEITFKIVNKDKADALLK